MTLRRSRAVRLPLALGCALAVGLAPALLAAGPATAAPQAAVGTPSPAPAAVPGELVVGYVAGADAADRARARGRANAVRQERVVPGHARRAEVELVRLPAGADRSRAARALEADPAVAYAEPNWIYTHQRKPVPQPAPRTATAAVADDPYFADGSLWGMYGDTREPANEYGSQAAEAWAGGHTGSSAVFVGVIDEGIQFDHPDLAGQVWTNPFDPADGVDNDNNGYVDDVHGWDFEGGDNTIYDGGNRGALDDHGTHVAGTIGAKANNGQGVVGVTWNTTMISGKFLGRRGGSLADAVRAVDYFTDLKVRHRLNVVATNNSWGGGGFSQALHDAIARANAAGILFVAAAGNSGTNNDVNAGYPSGYDLPNVIAVAAIGQDGALADFSQYGRKSVDLGAPGVGIWSTTAYNDYSAYSGTSMATPHVTGAAALYAASRPGASATQIRDAILTTAAPTASLSGKTVTGGRLNASDF